MSSPETRPSKWCGQSPLGSCSFTSNTRKSSRPSFHSRSPGVGPSSLLQPWRVRRVEGYQASKLGHLCWQPLCPQAPHHMPPSVVDGHATPHQGPQRPVPARPPGPSHPCLLPPQGEWGHHAPEVCFRLCGGGFIMHCIYSTSPLTHPGTREGAERGHSPGPRQPCAL